MATEVGGTPLALRSSLYDQRVARLISRLAECNATAGREQARSTSAADTGMQNVEAAYDWAALYATGNASTSRAVGRRERNPVQPYVGPIDVVEIAGRGLGLVLTQDVQAGTLLLVEAAWVLASPSGDATQPQESRLLDLCCAQLLDEAADALEKSLVLQMHAGSDPHSGSSIEDRCGLFRNYLFKLKGASEGSAHCTSQAGASSAGAAAEPGLQSSAALDRQQLSKILAANARKTEWWNPLTLLVDDSVACSGLWLAASLFNHSCRGNVTLTYCNQSTNEGAGDREDATGGRHPVLVARAAYDLKSGTELCHTYIYPFETVDERRSRLQRTHGFLCSCERCNLEAALAEHSGRLADNLDRCVGAYSEASRSGNLQSMPKIVKDFQAALADVDKVAATVVMQDVGPCMDARLLWKSQFVWGFHGLAMAAQRRGLFKDSVEAFRICVQLIVAAAPSTDYELKYRCMLLQCLARQLLTTGPGGRAAGASQVAADLRTALREAEEAHSRCYGGGARHFLTRMKGRLDEVYAALRRSTSTSK